MKKTTKISLLALIVVFAFSIYCFYPKKAELEGFDNENEVGNDLGVLIENDGEQVNAEDAKVTEDTENLERDENMELQKTQNEQRTQSKIDIPASKKLNVAFVPQAPFHDWAEPWQNACEEAALLTAHHYLKGNKEVSKEQVKSEIEKMLFWQDRYFGSHKDLKAEEVAEMAKNYLDYSDVEVLYNITIEDIKAEIALGNVVVLPMAGRILENPHFTQPAPVYHMLAAIGYTENKIITNDPGTQFGKDLEYSYNNFYNSIHDFVNGANENPDLMERGGKVMIVVK